jgi:cytochrome c biogenesis protein CcdA
MKIIKSPVFELFTYVVGALILRFILEQFIDEKYGFWVRMVSVVVILLFGALFVLKGTAKIIEETTGVLSKKNKAGRRNAPVLGNRLSRYDTWSGGCCYQLATG